MSGHRAHTHEAAGTPLQIAGLLVLWLLLIAWMLAAAPKAHGATIRESMEQATTREAAVAEQDAKLEIAKLKRRAFVLELENEATRQIADGTAADIASGGADIATTGWAWANGGAEANAALGASKSNALIVIGTKVVGLAATYGLRRKQLGDWKQCMVNAYDAGAEPHCGQKDTSTWITRLTTLARTGIAVWNANIARKAARQ